MAKASRALPVAQSFIAAPSESSRARVLRAAAGLFRTKGYAGTSTRDIAAAIGWKSASLYEYMGRKEDLLYALFVSSQQRLRAAVETALRAERDPLARIRAMVMAHLRQALSDRDEYAATRMELHFLTPQRRARISALRHSYGLLFARAIREGQRAGQIRDDLSADDITLSLLLWLNGCIFWITPELDIAVKRGRRGAPRPERLIDLVSTLFLTGAGTSRDLRLVHGRTRGRHNGPARSVPIDR